MSQTKQKLTSEMLNEARAMDAQTADEAESSTDV